MTSQGLSSSITGQPMTSQGSNQMAGKHMKVCTFYNIPLLQEVYF